MAMQALTDATRRSLGDPGERRLAVRMVPSTFNRRGLHNCGGRARSVLEHSVVRAAQSGFDPHLAYRDLFGSSGLLQTWPQSARSEVTRSRAQQKCG